MYDPWGVAKSVSSDVVKILEKKTKESAHQALLSMWCDGSVVSHLLGDRKDSNLQELKLNMISRESGRQALAETARKLCYLQQISQEAIAKELRLTHHISEPEFLLKFGKVDSMLGYPPWALRVTEILPVKNVQTSGNLKEIQFVECLENFSKRDQRFGK